MKKLSPANFERAAAFINMQARELDKRLFTYHFEGGTAVSVLDALAYYQNDDGGFGKAIEPDFRLQASSPMATSVGLQYCAAVAATADHSIVQGAIRYLIDAYDAEHNYWPATYENVNEEPHAWWWHVEKLTPPDETRWPNPSAELVGYLHRYAALAPAEFLERVTARAEQNLAGADIIDKKYNVLCWERARPWLPESLQTAVIRAINRTYTALSPIAIDSFDELGLLAFAPTPAALMAQAAPDVVQQALDQEIDNQAEDGGWWPGWHWGQYEDVWPIAKQEWAGKITADTLHTLKNYDRIA